MSEISSTDVSKLIEHFKQWRIGVEKKSFVLPKKKFDESPG
jgi:hypothetical protein